jgi:ABC-type polysaccharide/polyol phosphate export permease
MISLIQIWTWYKNILYSWKFCDLTVKICWVDILLCFLSFLYHLAEHFLTTFVSPWSLVSAVIYNHLIKLSSLKQVYFKIIPIIGLNDIWAKIMKSDRCDSTLWWKVQKLTLTLSKLTMQVPEALNPSLSSFLPILNPGVFLSTMKQVIPL